MFSIMTNVIAAALRSRVIQVSPPRFQMHGPPLIRLDVPYTFSRFSSELWKAGSG